MTTPTSTAYKDARRAALGVSEGFVGYVYIDLKGHPTAGVGTLLSKWNGSGFTQQKGSTNENLEIFNEKLGAAATPFNAARARYEEIVAAHPDEYAAMLLKNELQSFKAFTDSKFYNDYLKDEFVFTKQGVAPAITGYRAVAGDASSYKEIQGFDKDTANQIFDTIVDRRMESRLERAATDATYDLNQLSDNQRIALLSRVYQTPSTAKGLVEAAKSGDDSAMIKALNSGRNGLYAERTLDEFARFKGEVAFTDSDGNKTILYTDAKGRDIRIYVDKATGRLNAEMGVTDANGVYTTVPYNPLTQKPAPAGGTQLAANPDASIDVAANALAARLTELDGAQGDNNLDEDAPAVEDELNKEAARADVIKTWLQTTYGDDLVWDAASGTLKRANGTPVAQVNVDEPQGTLAIKGVGGEGLEISSDSYVNVAGVFMDTITDTPDGAGGMNRVVTTVVDGQEVVINQHATAAALADGEGAGDYDTTDVAIGGSDAVNSDLIERAIDDSYQSASDIIRARAVTLGLEDRNDAQWRAAA